MSDNSAEYVRQIEGYVWCDARGEIHSAYPGTNDAKTHHGQEYWDIYQDGVLCTKSDHRYVYAVTTADEADSFGPSVAQIKSDG